jgi:uncharacterized protein HemX
MVETIVVPILLALLTTLAAIYATRQQDKRLAEKQDTERAAALNDMALELIQPYKAEVAELRNKVIALECDLRNARELSAAKDKRIVEMQQEIDGLHREVEALKKERQ